MEIDAGFAPDHDGARWTYTGALTFANAGPVLAATSALALPTDGEVDLDNIGAHRFVRRRRAGRARAARGRSEGKPLRFVHVPAALAALAEVYGVEEILGA